MGHFGVASQLLLLLTSRILAWGSRGFGRQKSDIFFVVVVFLFSLEVAYGNVEMGAWFIVEKAENLSELDGRGAIL